jgi:hypothetical protein
MGIGMSGVLSVIAQKLTSHLNLVDGVEAEHVRYPRAGFDVTHHLIYTMAAPLKSGLTTAMITHIDSRHKEAKVQSLMRGGVIGICLSNHTKEFLNEILNHDHKAQLFVAVPPPLVTNVTRKLKIAFLSNAYSDGRKNEDILLDIGGLQHSRLLELSLMGSGLKAIAESLLELGVTVNHWDMFDSQIYEQILGSTDLLVYFGWDEGAMCVMDATLAGVEVLTTDQGFHRELNSSRVSLFKETEKITSHIANLLNEKNSQMAIAEKFNWEKFALRHLQIWDQVLLSDDNDCHATCSSSPVENFTEG